MELSLSQPIAGKDGKFYVRVVGATKGVLKQRIEKSGFLKFDSQSDADEAFTALQSGDVTIKFGDKQLNADLHEIIVIEPVAQTVTH